MDGGVCYLQMMTFLGCGYSGGRKFSLVWTLVTWFAAAGMVLIAAAWLVRVCLCPLLCACWQFGSFLGS
jgi:hypothetical protein